jgi:hypothetical protein
MHVAVNDLKWDTSAKTLKVLFLIGDAPPHAYPHDYDCKTEARKAIAEGIQINTIGCQGLENTGGTAVFQEIAKLADGKYEPLSYHAEVATGGGGTKTVISSGGKMYEVAAGKRAKWRDGADELARAGDLKELAAPAFAAAPLASSMPVRRALMGKPMAGKALGGAAFMDSEGTMSRGDSNLADMVLSQTKAAAKKKLGIDFESK